MPKDRSPRRRPEAKNRKTDPKPHRLRWSWLFVGLSLVLVAAATYSLLHSPLLTVRQVRVEGTDSLDQAALVEMSGLEGASMLRLPLDRARSRLLEVPEIRAVHFDRDLSRGVTIRVEEREPYAFWSVGGRDYPVDIEGVVLAAGVPSGQPLRIVEPDAGRLMGPGDRVDPDALAFASRIATESPRFLNQAVRELEYRPGVGVTAVFGGGLRVTFGDDRSYDYKVAVLSKLIEQLSARGQTPRAVDLRFGERVTYE